MPSGGEVRKQRKEMKQMKVKEKTEGKSLSQGERDAAVKDDKGWRDKKTEGRRERTEERERERLRLSCVL